MMSKRLMRRSKLGFGRRPRDATDRQTAVPRSVAVHLNARHIAFIEAEADRNLAAIARRASGRSAWHAGSRCMNPRSRCRTGGPLGVKLDRLS
jgi:hypothetical protein